MSDLKCIGVDLYVIHTNPGVPPMPETSGGLKLQLISERGMKVWPGPVPDGIITQWFRCRYLADQASDKDIQNLATSLPPTVMWEKVQKLWNINGKDAFSKAYES
jgi:hypothetical protein